MRRRRDVRDPLAAPESLQAILQRAGENRFARNRPPIELGLWRDAVGARIADRARPVSLDDGVLLLQVASSVWAHELSLLSTTLRERLLERGVEVRELRFRVADNPFASRRLIPRSLRAVPAIEPLPPELDRAVRDVGDVDLRQVIARAAAANLAAAKLRDPVAPGPVSEARRGARAPRDAGAGTCPPDRKTPTSTGHAPRTPSGGRDRSR